ncbi:hypothetical protein [Amycolatopsis tolypomycina]|uniref:Uncharacterized protein n=1 Tax=Amycolatopsis tolypomycina TaxID=208445 RepID=A0A1H4J017_9PSEU|nr:hypothetical protein [Amycolatopsis tolypomycina]SEB39266.1 hypothetical protein SAMN04489727_1314 [Amycolatopsis tolypomycina]
MTDHPHDLEALVRTHIEEPAARRLLEMQAAGLITEADSEVFRASAQRYKEAAFAQYAGFDPDVRSQLVQALLADYEREVARLLQEIAARQPAPPPITAQPAEPAPERDSGPRRFLRDAVQGLRRARKQ